MQRQARSRVLRCLRSQEWFAIVAAGVKIPKVPV
jgi:hypothetical protein